MNKRFQSILCAVVVLSAIAAPVTIRATSIRDMSYLLGSWNCSSKSGKYTESWAYAVRGGFLRATDTGSRMAAQEHALSYSKDGKVLTVVSIYSDGTSDIMRGTGSGGHAVLYAAFPRSDTKVVFNRVSAAKYTVDVSGTDRGKPFKDLNVCTK